LPSLVGLTERVCVEDESHGLFGDGGDCGSEGPRLCRRSYGKTERVCVEDHLPGFFEDGGDCGCEGPRLCRRSFDK